MTCWSMWMNLYEESIIITINLDIDKVEEVTTSFALCPKTLLPRLQKVTFLVSKVFFKDSSFIYPNIRTFFVTASWMIAGTKPPPFSKSIFILLLFLLFVNNLSILVLVFLQSGTHLRPKQHQHVRF